MSKFFGMIVNVPNITLQVEATTADNDDIGIHLRNCRPFCVFRLWPFLSSNCRNCTSKVHIWGVQCPPSKGGSNHSRINIRGLGFAGSRCSSIVLFSRLKLFNHSFLSCSPRSSIPHDAATVTKLSETSSRVCGVNDITLTAVPPFS